MKEGTIPPVPSSFFADKKVFFVYTPPFPSASIQKVPFVCGKKIRETFTLYLQSKLLFVGHGTVYLPKRLPMPNANLVNPMPFPFSSAPQIAPNSIHSGGRMHTYARTEETSIIVFTENCGFPSLRFPHVVCPESKMQKKSGRTGALIKTAAFSFREWKIQGNPRCVNGAIIIHHIPQLFGKVNIKAPNVNVKRVFEW